EAHKRIIRLRIADELLKADVGLKMRWDILRTETGRQKLRQETAATVDLAGYEDVEQLEASLKNLRFAYTSVERLPDQYLLSFEQFAGFAKLDLAAVIDSRTMVWGEDKQKVLDYFQTVSEQFEQARKVMRALGLHTWPLDNLVRSLSSFYNLTGPAQMDQPLMRVDAQAIYSRVIPELEQKDLLAGFPKSIK
ncbi:hypothetical protein, partial [Hymenobacter sp.]|uniref:hypothetical protein n=1 Tax=Hymenobacter sp. TaxID=1898978 RepID=UPI002EDA71E9